MTWKRGTETIGGSKVSYYISWFCSDIKKSCNLDEIPSIVTTSLLIIEKTFYFKACLVATCMRPVCYLSVYKSFDRNQIFNVLKIIV